MTEGAPTPENKSEAFPTNAQILSHIDYMMKDAITFKEMEKVVEAGLLKNYSVEVIMPDGKKMEIVYKSAQHLAGEDFPSRIHSVIYGTDTEGSERGPEYIFKNGTWEEDKLPEDPRGQS